MKEFKILGFFSAILFGFALLSVTFKAELPYILTFSNFGSYFFGCALMRWNDEKDMKK